MGDLEAWDGLLDALALVGEVLGVTPFVADPDFTLYVGDVRECLRELPDSSVHCVVTSPPYWGLRDYGTGSWEGGDPACDHKRPVSHASIASSTIEGGKSTVNEQQTGYAQTCGKCGAVRVDRQIGLEPTPDEFVESLVAVFREVKRVLRADGTLWLNLGDSYASNTKGSGGLNSTTIGSGRGQASSVGSLYDVRRLDHGLKEKDLVGIPWRVAFALQQDGWYLRSDIVWSKPNPMPESVTDRPTKAHEYVFLLSKSLRYFFDQEAVREKATHEGRIVRATGEAAKNGQKGDFGRTAAGFTSHDTLVTGRNVRSVWTIATQPYPEAHFATFPEALPERCIQAGTSERGCCPECGAPWEREVARQNESTYAQIKREYGITYKDMQAEAAANGITPGNVGGTHAPGRRGANLPPSQYLTTGWRPTCDHDTPSVPCTVLDPFMGSGTTALVARHLGRKSIGIELNPEYAELAARRLQQLSLLTEGVA